MKKWFYTVLISIAVAAGCDMPPDMNRPGDKLDGYIFYVDTNLIFSGGFYSVSIYSADSTNTFQRVPFRTDSLNNFIPYGWGFQAQYSMDGIPQGRFYIASTWSRYPRIPNEKPKILGTYGCDTLYSCTQHKVVVYPNIQGNYRNIWSWTDTTKALY